MDADAFIADVASRIASADWSIPLNAPDRVLAMSFEISDYELANLNGRIQEEDILAIVQAVVQERFGAQAVVTVRVQRGFSRAATVIVVSAKLSRETVAMTGAMRASFPLGLGPMRAGKIAELEVPGEPDVPQAPQVTRRIRIPNGGD